MTESARPPSATAEEAGRPAWSRVRLPRRRRSRIAAGVVVAAAAIGLAVVLRPAGQPSIAGSPALPSTFRPGSGIGPVSLGETRAAVRAALGGQGRQVAAGTLVFDRSVGQLAVAFTAGRAVRILATGAGNPFGQRLAAEETTLAAWTVAFCQKPARVLLVAPGGHTYLAFANATAGVGAVGVSSAPIRACSALG